MDRNMKIYLSLILLTILSSTWCGCVAVDTSISNLKWKVIASYSGGVREHYDDLVADDKKPRTDSEYFYVGRTPRLIVLTDKTNLPALQSQVRPADQRKISRINFSSHWVIVINLGYRNDSGYTIDVKSVEYEENEVIISASLSEPSVMDEKWSSPYYVLRIQKPAHVESDVTFLLDMDGTMISQVCAITGEPIPWDKVLNGGYGRHSEQEPKLAVIDEESSLSENILNSDDMKLLSSVDFSKYFVAIVYQGRKSTTSYALEVLAVTRQDDAIKICVQFHEPELGQATGQAITSPYYILTIKRPQRDMSLHSIDLYIDDDLLIREEF